MYRMSSSGAPQATLRWQRHRACIDYRAWMLPLQDLEARAWPTLIEALAGLGQARPDPTGVVTVRGPWGFLLVPPRGFPELRLNCYKNISADRERDLLTDIAALVHQARLGTEPDEQ